MGGYLPIGERLREQRENLGMNQTDFAAAAGVSRKTLFGYETGERAPDAAALAAWEKLGVDVLYVITGKGHIVTDQSNPATSPGLPETTHPVTESKAVTEGPPLDDQAATAGQIPAMPVLSRRERHLLANYRGSDEEGRRAMEATASALAHRDSAKKNRQEGE